MVILGLVGKPSAGKSTFFASATMATVEINSRPFTTIEPNIGTAYVRVKDLGPELGVKSNPRTGFIEKDIRFVPVKLVDVAGLIPDAHKGKGLGNQFLNDLSYAYALIHVVDISGSTNEQGEFVGYGNHDVEKDILFLEEEINMWYLSILERNLEKMLRLRRGKRESKEILMEIFSSFRVDESLAEEVVKKYGDIEQWESQETKKEVAVYMRKKTKPIVIAANKIDLPEAEENFKQLSKKYDMIPTSAESELALRRAKKAGLVDYTPGDSDFEPKGDLRKEQKSALEKIRSILKKFGSTGVQQTLDYAVFDLLKYKAIFPAGAKLKDKDGNVLPDCFLLEGNATVYDFAMKIHSDIAKNLLYAIDIRTKKRLVKDHVLEHIDGIELISAARKK